MRSRARRPRNRTFSKAELRRREHFYKRSAPSESPLSHSFIIIIISDRLLAHSLPAVPARTFLQQLMVQFDLEPHYFLAGGLQTQAEAPHQQLGDTSSVWMCLSFRRGVPGCLRRPTGGVLFPSLSGLMGETANSGANRAFKCVTHRRMTAETDSEQVTAAGRRGQNSDTQK